MKLIQNRRLDHYIVEIMIDERCTLSEAMDIILYEQKVNDKSVFDVVDFLEQHLESLDTVSVWMDIYTGKTDDLVLIEKEDRMSLF